MMILIEHSLVAIRASDVKQVEMVHQARRQAQPVIRLFLTDGTTHLLILDEAVDALAALGLKWDGEEPENGMQQLAPKGAPQ